MPQSWQCRTSAPPHLRTSAPPHFRTSAPPHFRTSAPPQVRLKFGVNMVYGTNNQVVELNTSITVYGINLKTTAKTPQLIRSQNAATYLLSKHCNLFTLKTPQLIHSPKPTATRSHTNTATYSLTKRRNLFTYKTPQLIHSQNAATYSLTMLTETNH